MKNELNESPEIEIDWSQVTDHNYSSVEKVYCDNLIAFNRLTISEEKIPQIGKFLFLEDEWNTLGYDQKTTKTRTFSLNNKSWNQLCQLNPEIARWDSLTKKWHYDSLPSKETNVPRVVELLIARELHYIYEMTFLVSYELGKPNPFHDAISILNIIHGDKELLGGIVHADSWEYGGSQPISCGTLEFSIVSREYQDFGDTFIGINQVGHTINIELPWYGIWEECGLEWIWHKFSCCGRKNLTPWAGRVCNCVRPY